MTEQDKILTELLSESGVLIHSLLVRLTLRRSIAEDIMILLFEALAADHSLLKVKGLNAYAIRCAIYLACRWRLGKKMPITTRAQTTSPTRGSKDPLDLIILHEQPDEILDAAAHLNANLRFVFVMRYIQGESYDRIGERMRRTANHIRNLCFKARTKVLARMESDDPETNERKLSRKLKIIAQIEPDFDIAETAIQKINRIFAEGLDTRAVKHLSLPYRFSNTSMIAVATAASVVLLFAIYLFWIGRTEPLPRQVVRSVGDRTNAPLKITEQKVAPISQPDRSELLNSMAAMFDRKDVDALIKMLDQPDFAVRLMAATYLARIADPKAIAALEKLSRKWQKDNNPFAVAIAQIQQQNDDDTDQTEEELTLDLPVEPLGKLPPNQAQTPSTKKITYTGIVTGPQGQPLQGVTVTSDLFYAVRPAILKELQSQTKTDADGRFELGPVDQSNDRDFFRQVSFHLPGFANAWLRSDQIKDIEISLAEPAIFFGRVVDRSGSPILDAKVIVNVLGSSNKNQYLITKTTANGIFSFDQIPDDSRIALEIFKPKYQLYSSRYLEQFFDVETADPIQIVLDPGAAIQGQLISNGTDFTKKGIYIKHNALGTWGITDKDGKFQIAGLVPDTDVTLFVYTENIITGPGLISKPLTVRPRSDRIEQIQLQLVDGRNVAVRFLDNLTDQGVNNSRFFITTFDDIPVMQARSDQDGAIDITLPPGQYELVCTNRNWENRQYTPVYAQFIVRPDQTTTLVEVGLNTRPTIAGTLTDSYGTPVPGVVEFASNRGYTDAQGQFSFEEPADFPEEFICFAFDKQRSIGRAFYWQSGRSARDMQIELLSFASVTGTVIDPNGAPAPQAPLWYGFLDPDGQLNEEYIDQTKTDKQGNFEIQSFVVGLPVMIHADIAGQRDAILIEDLNPGETTNIGDIPGYR